MNYSAGLVYRSLYRRLDREVNIFTSFPKSASTYFQSIIKSALEEKIYILKPKVSSGFGHNFISEKKIYPFLRKVVSIKDILYMLGRRHGKRHRNEHNKNILISGHMPNYFKNIEIINSFSDKLNVVVLIRSLPDIVASYKDYIDMGANGITSFTNPWDGHPDWNKTSDFDKYNFFINYSIPWYIRYLTGWIQDAKKYKIEIVTYEEITQYPEESLKYVLDFMNINHILKRRDYNNTIQKKINFNKGKMGRGKQYLTIDQLERIKYIMQLHGKYYNNTLLADYLLNGFQNMPFNPIEFLKEKHELIKIGTPNSINLLLNKCSKK